MVDSRECLVDLEWVRERRKRGEEKREKRGKERRKKNKAEGWRGREREDRDRKGESEREKRVVVGALVEFAAATKSSVASVYVIF